MTTKASSFIWYELMTNDLEAATEFYGSVIGWSARKSGTPGMDYRLWINGEDGVGGLMALPADAAAQGMTPTWLGYLDVPDVDASVAAVTAAAGAVHMPPTTIPGIGRLAMVTDPQGAPFYVMTPIGEGPSPAFAPGKPGHGGWHELHTSDGEAAFAFYGAHFGWGRSDALDMGPMGIYQLFNAGGDAIGGMMTNRTVPRPGWLYYFNVEDIDAAKTRVEAAGGTVLRGPQEVPGGSWILQARDPQGALVALVGPRHAAA